MQKLFRTAILALLTATAALAQSAPQAIPVAPVTPPKPAAVSTNTGASSVPSAIPLPGDLLVGSGDLVSVSVADAPEYTRELRVNHSGEISLPLIGSVHVAGLTVDQAQSSIASRLSAGRYFRNPQVSFFVKEYATQGISVLGEVAKPGIYPLLGRHTLYDAISAAGGLSPKAGRKVMIMRRGKTQAETVEVSSSTADWSQSNIAVEPGDTVMVSKAGIVYVVGDVKLPGGFVMENSKMTVLQAVAMAQGTTPTASLGKAKLIRRTSSGQTESTVALNKIYSAQQPDINLEPEDILFIPSSRTKSGFRRGLDTILSTASGMAIYHPL